MGTSKEAKQIYEFILNETWDKMESFFKRNKLWVMSPVSVSRDTALHLAVYSLKEEPLKTLLDISQSPGIPKPKSKDAWSITNAYDNTILHEAIIAGNVDAVKLLVPNKNLTDARLEELLKRTNVSGETPLFTAASYGRKIILKYLVDLPGQFVNDKLNEDHRKRKDGSSILHAAIKSQHFVTARILLEKDGSLHDMEDSEGRTCLHLLADMPSAFKSGRNMGSFSRFIYSCGFPDTGDMGDQSCFDKVLKPIRLICRKFFTGWPMAENIWKEKKTHRSAERLVELLVKMNFWQGQFIKAGSFTVSVESSYGGERKGEEGANNNVNVQGGGGGGRQQEVAENENVKGKENDNVNVKRGGQREAVEINVNVQPKILVEKSVPRKITRPENPLFIATYNGIVDIVEKILQTYPQAIELVNDCGQTLLHVAVLFRQLEIFRLVKRNKILLSRMAFKIDNNGYSLLHHAADTTHYLGGTRRGPAFQLQEELVWFKRVKKIAPDCHVMHRETKGGMTADQLFLKHHKAQLDNAKEWIEKTSQSCSTVAILVATVVFTAAYTIPGGSNDHGLPIFLYDRFFIGFTILDVIALSSSLTSVVMFLSILTTPFECKKFYQSIPRKLIWGFTLLFLSVMTTMLAFACTLFLIIRFRKRWTAGLMSIAAFLPVSVFAMMQFSLYSEVLKSVKEFYKQTMKSLPYFGSRRQSSRRQRNKRLFTFDR